jgi:DNA modification methylase
MDKGVMHPAMYPRGIPDFLIQTFTKEGDVVLDPFAGSGQTCIAAVELGRHYIGFDCKEEYCQMSVERIEALKIKP